MSRLACSFALLWTLSQPVLAQEIGEPFAVDLSGTETTLTLDFSEHDYELILYSFNTTEPPDQKFNRVFSFTVTGAFAGSRPAVPADPNEKSAVPTDRERLEFELRKREQALARRLQQAGGYRPPAPKVVRQEIGSTRRFVFPTFGNVTRDTITAALVATSDRAHAYIDVADTSDVMTEQIQEQIDYFSTKTHPVVTSTFGDESDVDNDGKVHLLYTHLVDEVGDFFSKVGGFYDAASVLRNLSDLLYINPNIDPNAFDAVIAHEFQHLISFNQHVLVRNGPHEEIWLNEGLSHVCEDLIGRHDAHNRDFTETLLNFPEAWPLRDLPSTGSRGATYLLVRSLMEEFGPDILSRLVQTDKAGIANIEHATGQPFAGIFDRHLSRLFLTGSGLNSTFNYTTPFLVDTTTGARAHIPPRDRVVSPQSPSVSREIPSLSASYLRLLSNQSQGTITIQTDVEGDFRAQLVPVPRHFLFGTTLETPHAGPFPPHQPIHITGTVPDRSVSEIWFKFIRGDRDRTLESRGPVINGRFSHRLFFSHEQAGEYQIEIWLAPPDRPRFSVGTYYPLRIEKGEGTAPIPVDFFDDIIFSSPIPLEYTTGQAVRIAGTVSDPLVFKIDFDFREYVEEVEGQGYYRTAIAFDTPVTNGQFSKTFRFLHEQAGEYQFRVEMRRANNPQWPLYLGGIFSPIIIKKGQGVAPLPVDFFDGITFTSPLPVEYTIGQITRIAGTVSDPLVSDIQFRFRPIDDAGKSVELDVSVTNGQFSTTLHFSSEQLIGEHYELDIFMKKIGSGQWPWVGSFSPITVKAAPSPDFDGDGTVGFTDFIAFAAAFGKSSGDEDFDARFDLDGDGTVGFTDFIKFAAAFGRPLEN